ncbi:hypothetical protein D3C78_1712750 [compost metagenome]
MENIIREHSSDSISRALLASEIYSPFFFSNNNLVEWPRSASSFATLKTALSAPPPSKLGRKKVILFSLASTVNVSFVKFLINFVLILV